MSYKLINKTTQEEHICSKVVIAGFDYYVNDDEILENDYVYENNLNQEYKISKIFKRNNELGFFRFRNVWIPFNKQNNAKKVIATNNPNIDLLLLQVIDKVEELAETISTEFAIKEIWKNGYNKSQKTHSFNEDDMIEFGLFCANFAFSNGENKTRKELLELWKEQHSEIIYFN